MWDSGSCREVVDLTKRRVPKYDNWAEDVGPDGSRGSNWRGYSWLRIGVGRRIGGVYEAMILVYQSIKYCSIIVLILNSIYSVLTPNTTGGGVVNKTYK